MGLGRRGGGVGGGGERFGQGAQDAVDQAGNCAGVPGGAGRRVGGGQQGGLGAEGGVVRGGEGPARSVKICAPQIADALRAVRPVLTSRRASAICGAQGAPGSQKSAAWRRRSAS